jgi:Protein of unknown function (DUF2510)
MEPSTFIIQMAETVPLQGLPKVAWFPDTSGSTPPGTLRCWDGHGWTAELHEPANQPFPHGSAA